MKLKISLLFPSVVFVCFLLGIYSCSSGNYDVVDNSTSLNCVEKTEVATRSIQNRDILMETISESDEFLDYGMNCMLLAEKMKSYTSTLTPEKFDELMNNLNNDDYMMDLVSKVDVKKELLMVENAQKELLKNANFNLLNESERMNVFMKFSGNPQITLIKARGEGGGGITKEECRRRLNEDYTYASAIYLAAMVGCSCATGGLGVCLCAIAASAAYDYAITLADRSYHDCMSNAV